jgi:hypothetical protein
MYRFWKTKTTTLRLAAILALSLALTAVPADAQVTGAILSGTISDPSGAPIVNAKVEIHNDSTGIAVDWATNSDGFYSAPNLLPGTYTLTVSAPGFSTLKRSGIVLAVGAQPVVNLTMQIGKVEQVVQVSGEMAEIQTADSAVSAEVSGRTVRELPLNGRDWTQLATLQPGISAVRSQAVTTSTANRGNRGLGDQLTDSGHRPYENNYRVNGVSVNDYTNGSPGSTLGANLGVDGIQEFSVESTDYPAEYGRTSGAVINAITKSGTNSYHGSAYWFLRDEGLDARNFFDGSKIAPFHRNQFGTSLGGPIHRDKTFFFVNYEGVRQDLGQSFHDSVPSASARAGNLCSEPSLGTGTPCTPTTVVVDPNVAKFLQFWPAPNAGLSPTGHGDIGFFNGAGNQATSENYVIARVDHTVSAKDSVALSYFFDNAPQTFPDALLSSVFENLSGRQMFGFEETHIASSSFVNTARAGWSRTRGRFSEGLSAINPAADDPSFAAVPGRFAPVTVVPGLTTFQGGLGAMSDIAHAQNSIQAYDDAFWTKGTHSIKFGFAFERIQYNVEAKIRENGQFSFPSLQNFLLNEPTNVQLLSPFFPVEEVAARQNLIGMYLQDSWRATHSLTLNLGLRYEFTSLPVDANNAFGVLPDLYTSTNTPVEHLWSKNPTLRNFEPRVGFSWDPFRDGKTALRGAFGIFDIQPLPWVYGLGSSEALPYSLQVSASNLPQGSFPNGVAALVDNNGGTNAGSRYVDQNPKRSFAMNWNLNLQRELGWQTMLTIGYIGSHSTHLPENVQDANMVLPTMTPAGYEWPYPVGSGTRLNPNVGLIRTNLFNGTAVYNGLDIGVIKRMSHNIQVQASYTNGRCTDNGSSGATDSFLNSLQSPLFFDYPQTHGPCDFDIRSAFVLNYIWDIPSPKFSSTILRHATGGWVFSGLLTVSSGVPFTPVMAGDPLGQRSSTPQPFPDRLYGGACNTAVNLSNPNKYIDLACFTPPVVPAGVSPADLPFACQPAAASINLPNTCMNLLGNVTRNSLRGPDLRELDVALLKNTYVPRISETFNVQFRVDAFNILNRPNFQVPNTNDGNAVVLTSTGTTSGGNAGALVSTATTSRQIQLSLKIIW